MYVARLSVAAALIGVIFFSWQLFSNKNSRINNTAAVKNPVNNNAKANDQIKVTSPQTSSLPKQQADDSQQAIVQQQAPEKKKSTPDIGEISSEKIRKQNATQQEIAIAPVHQDKQPDMATKQTETALQKQPSVDVVSNTNSATTADALKPLEEVDYQSTDAQTASLLSDDNSALVQPAVYKELKTDDESQTLYVGSFQFNKAKVNGFVKALRTCLAAGRSKTQNKDIDHTFYILTLNIKSQ